MFTIELYIRDLSVRNDNCRGKSIYFYIVVVSVPGNFL